MKHLVIVLICLFTVSTLSAQDLSKAEKKELLLQIKELKKDPAKLKKLKENVEVRDLTIEQQTEEISILKNDLQTRNLKIASLSDSITTLASITSKGSNLNSGTYVPGDAPLDHDGYKYRIQIGVFQNFNITHLFDEPKYIVHEDVNGMHRYSVGNFMNKSDAEAFKNELRRLGIKDAFVTTYIDGTRDTDKKPVSQPVVVQPQKVEVTKQAVPSGFNVKPAKKTVPVQQVAPVKVNTHIESNPFPVQNGQVISSKPVKIDTKELNDKLQEEQEKAVPANIQQRNPSEAPKSSGIKINVGP